MASPTGPPDQGGPQVSLLRDRRLMTLLIAIGVILFVALTVVGFSGALFSSTSRSPGNLFEAGTVEIRLSQTGPVVDGTGMHPGAVRAGTQVVTNAGHRARLRLEAQGLTSSPLNDVLQVEVRQTQSGGSSAAYDGPLSGLGSVSLGILAHDESRTYTIVVEWPEALDGEILEGAATSLDFDWQLESVP